MRVVGETGPLAQRWALAVEYDGSGFAGFQRQPTPGLATVHGALEAALSQVGAAPIQCAVAGRTDRGVNGAAQCVSFWSYDRVDVREAIARCDAGRAGLLRVLDPPNGALLAPTRAFHATFCATWRRYVYVFPLRQAGLERPRTPTLERRLDVGRADAMLRKLVERSAEAGGVDCAAFARDADPARDATCVFKVARAFESAVPRETPEEARESHVEMMIGRGDEGGEGM